MTEIIEKINKYKPHYMRKKIKFTIDKNGCYNCISHQSQRYPKISIRYKIYNIARLIALFKYKNMPSGYVVRHICDNKKCINPEHIIMGTTKNNMMDKVERGLQAKGELIGTSVLKEEQVKEIFKSKKRGIDLAKECGVHPSTISAIKKRRNWGWLVNE